MPTRIGRLPIGETLSRVKNKAFNPTDQAATAVSPTLQHSVAVTPPMMPLASVAADRPVAAPGTCLTESDMPSPYFKYWKPTSAITTGEKTI